ncbi:hypothetical protein K0M31_014076, partial [Melipona bicolor]
MINLNQQTNQPDRDKSSNKESRERNPVTQRVHGQVSRSSRKKERGKGKQLIGGKYSSRHSRLVRAGAARTSRGGARVPGTSHCLRGVAATEGKGVEGETMYRTMEELTMPSMRRAPRQCGAVACSPPRSLNQ